MRKIVLGGMKHCGKSTVGKLLALKLGLPFGDLDDLILKEMSDYPSIREIYKNLGKKAFQQLEVEAFTHFKEKRGDSWVLALGGGVIDNILLCEKLGNNNIQKIYLNSEEEILFRRIARGGIPPFLESENPRSSFHDLYKRRTHSYSEWASSTVDANGKTPSEIVLELERIIRS